MLKSTILGLAAAAAIGSAGFLSNTASAAPVGQAAQVAQGIERTDVTPVHRRWYGHRPVYRGPVVSFGFYPGFYYGGYYHPRYYYRAGAPYHCHRWGARGYLNKRCHRHW